MIPSAFYRPDIDGLRAFAVLSVVMYHFFPFALPGGFTGVDVFFVISGFLIARIILEQLQNQTFSFLHFYARRIRRIFPALLLVLLCTLIVGHFIFFQWEFSLLAKHVLGGTLFISNFILFNESGYFDAGAEFKPLLHLWSLGIEEQFYILFPFLLFFAYQKHYKILTVLFFIFTASLFLNIQTIYKNGALAFYSPLCRIWELLLGAVLAKVLTQNNGGGGAYVVHGSTAFVIGLCLNRPEIIPIH